MRSEGRGRAHLPDGVASAQTNPLGDGAVLTLSFGKLLLGAEGLLALLDRGGLVALETVIEGIAVDGEKLIWSGERACLD